MTPTPIDPVLQRQLRKVGAHELAPPDAEQWKRLIERVSDSYAKAKEDRELLTRSLELSTAEMGKLNERLAGERDRMASVVGAIGEAMAVLEEAAADPGAGPDQISGALSVARRRFSARLGELFGAAAQPAASSWEHTSLTLATSGTAVTVDTLRRGFVALADQMGRMLRQTAEVAALRKELEVAGAVQQMLLPVDDFFTADHLRVAGSYQPASDCGGDWWTVRTLPDGRVLVVIGDVTGHGIPSAIVTGVATGACDVALRAIGPEIHPTALLDLLNHAIFGAGRQKMLMTCQVGMFDPSGRRLVIANGGHPFAFQVRDRTPSPIIARGSALGSSATGEFPAVSVDLAPGDLLVWFTDGVTELEAPNGEAFGERRLRALLSEVGPLDARDVRWEIRRALDRFRGDRPAQDDVTFVVARVS
ncbi:MAG: PP2C family protein-serine/threonine phosphatase [Myxococcota bacterium]